MADQQKELATLLDGKVVNFIGRVSSRRQPPPTDAEMEEYRDLLPKLRALAVLLPALAQALTDLDTLKSQAGCPAMRHILNQ